MTLYLESDPIVKWPAQGGAFGFGGEFAQTCQVSTYKFPQKYPRFWKPDRFCPGKRKHTIPYFCVKIKHYAPC
jgi:hypothetical protein